MLHGTNYPADNLATMPLPMLINESPYHHTAMNPHQHWVAIVNGATTMEAGMQVCPFVIHAHRPPGMQACVRHARNVIKR